MRELIVHVITPINRASLLARYIIQSSRGLLEEYGGTLNNTQET